MEEVKHLRAQELTRWLQGHGLESLSDALCCVTGKELVETADEGNVPLATQFKLSIHQAGRLRHCLRYPRVVEERLEFLNELGLRDASFAEAWVFKPVKTRHQTLIAAFRSWAREQQGAHLVASAGNPVAAVLSLVSLSRDAEERNRTLDDNETDTLHLISDMKLVPWAVEQLRKLDKPGKRYHFEDLFEEFLDNVWFADRVVRHELSRNSGPLEAIKRFVCSNHTHDAINKAASQLKNTFTSITTIMTSLHGSAPPASFDCLEDLRARDAIDFYVQQIGQEQVPVQVLLDAMESNIDCLDTQSTCSRLIDEPSIYSFFAGKNGTRDTTTVHAFKSFINGHPSMAEAVLHHLSSDPRHFADLALRRALCPADFGTDLLQHQRRFAEGTRQWVFDAFEAWAMHDPDIHSPKRPKRSQSLSNQDKRVFWIRGTGGLGKSVIAAQLVQRYGSEAQSGGDSHHGDDKPLIAAHFFCKHDDVARNNPLKAINTLAFRLATQLPELREEYRAILQGANVERRNIFTEHAAGIHDCLKDAFENVLANPLKAALKKRPQSAGDVFVLIDALDELRDGTSRTKFLRLVGGQLQLLPPCVRFVVTSRPEEDILAFFKNLDPFTIDRQDEQQRDDLKMFVHNTIIEQTSLCKLKHAEQEEAVNMIVEKADGVFLAGKLIVDAVANADANQRHSLTVSDVGDLLSTSGSFIDRTYTKTLDRIHARLKHAAAEIADVLPHADDAKGLAVLHLLQGALRDVLAVIVASRQPLPVGDLHELCGGGRVQNKVLTHQLLSALSLLFSASSKHDVIEPLHKTVNDFLTDKQRAGPHFVDEREGHAILARACLRVLQDRDLLAFCDSEAEATLIEEQSPQEPVVVYALQYGHVHLAQCGRAVQDARLPSYSQSDSMQRVLCRCEEALDGWNSCFVQKRKEEEAAQARDEVYPSSNEATTAFAQWLLLQAHTMGRKWSFQRELPVTAAAVSQVKDCLQLSHLLTDTSRVFGTYWVPEPLTLDGCAHFVANIPFNSCLHDSMASNWLWRASNHAKQVLRLPLDSPPMSLLRLAGHQAAVTSVAVAGDFIVSGSDDATLRVWNTCTGEQCPTINHCHGRVASVAASSDGSTIVSGHGDGTILVWQIHQDDETLSELNPDTAATAAAVTSVVTSRNGAQIASGDRRGRVRIWRKSPKSGNFSCAMTAYCHTQEYRVEAMATSRDGNVCAFARTDKFIRIWDTAQGQAQGQEFATLCASIVHSLAISDDRRLLASGHRDKCVRLWKMSTQGLSLLTTLEGHTDWVLCVAFSCNGKHLASGSKDKQVRVWDIGSISEPRRIACFSGHVSWVSCVAFLSNGKIVSGSGDNTLRFWHIEAKRDTSTSPLQTIRAVAASPDGELIAAGGEDKHIYLWDANTGKTQLHWHAHSDYIYALAFVRSGGTQRVPLLMSASRDQTICMWDIARGATLVRELKGHQGCVATIALSPSNALICSGGKEHVLRVWDLQKPEEPPQCFERPAWVMSVAFGAENLFATAGREREVRLFKVNVESEPEFLQEVGVCEGNTDFVHSVTFTPDCEHVVSGGRDCTIRVWCVHTRRLIRACTGHTNWINAVRVSQSGRLIVSGSRDTTVRLWQFSTGNQVAICKGHCDWVSSVAFLAREDQVMSGSGDGTVRVWQPQLQG